MRAHGTNARYHLGPDGDDQPGGCRCDPCTDAYRAYQTDYNARTEPRLVPAGPVRAHLLELRQHNIGPKTIARVSGVSHGSLSRLLYGDYVRGTPPSAKVRPETARILLALTLDDFDATGTREPSAPIRVMVDRLVDAGVPKSRIAERMATVGMRRHDAYLPPANFALSGQWVTRRKATAVRQMIAELEAGTLVTWRSNKHLGEVVIAPAPDGITTTETSTPVPNRWSEMTTSHALRTVDDWPADAACVGQPNWLFFATDATAKARARRLCRGCPVAQACLVAHRDEPDGIYGGADGRQRSKPPRAHGTVGRYRYGDYGCDTANGCRCAPCTAANTETMRRVRAARKTAA